MIGIQSRLGGKHSSLAKHPGFVNRAVGFCVGLFEVTLAEGRIPSLLLPLQQPLRRDSPH